MTPQEALAACTPGTNPNVCSGTTTTTPGAPIWFFGWSNTTGRERSNDILVQPDAMVNGLGLGATSVLGGRTVTNNGTVQSNPGSNENALDITVTNLNIISGTGTATYTGNAGSVLSGDLSGLSISTYTAGNANTNVILNGARVQGNKANGIVAISGSLRNATTSITGTGDNTVTGDTNGILGIAVSANRDATTNVNLSGDVTGDNGIVAVAGSVDLTWSSLGDFISNPADLNNILSGAAGDGKATVDVIHNGNITATNGIGIVAMGIGNGGNDVSARSNGYIDATDSPFGIGILAGSIGEDGKVSATVTDVDASLAGAIAFNPDGDASAHGRGDVNLTGDISLVGVGAFAQNGDARASLGRNGSIEADGLGIAGLAAVSVGGRAIVSNRGDISDVLVGAVGVSLGDGDVIVSNRGSIEAGLVGMAGFNYGNGDVRLINRGDVSGGLIGMAAGNIGNGDVDVIVGRGADVFGGLAGVLAISGGGDGDVDVNVGRGADVIGGLAGVVAMKTDGAGDVDVTIGRSATVGGLLAGVVASNEVGDTTVTSGRGARVLSLGTAIDASSDNGDVSVETGDRSITFSLLGSAISADAENGFADVHADGLVIGGALGTAVVDINSGTGAHFVNDGVVAALGLGIGNAAEGLALNAKGGGRISARNEGLMVGRVDLTDRSDRMVNDGAWLVRGTNNFGDGWDRLRNDGFIQTAFDGGEAEETRFENLERFRNLGILSMQDEDAGDNAAAARDYTYISGAFIGGGYLGIDAFLGKDGSTADVLFIGDGVIGTTRVNVNDVNSGAGGYNAKGIKFAIVNGGAVELDNFIMDEDSANAVRAGRNVIDKGMFFYDIALVPAAPSAPSADIYSLAIEPEVMPELPGDEFRLIGVPDHEAMEMPTLATAAQGIWHDTAGVWLDRQVDLRNQILMAGTMEQGADLPVAADPARKPGGAWGKVMGSWTSRDNGAALTIQGNDYTYDLGYRQNTFGFLGGLDIGDEDVFASGDTLLFGVMGGYIDSSLDFRASTTSIDYSGGTVGVYATYLNKGFFADALFKADILTATYSAPTLGVEEDARVRTYGFTLDTGYRFELPSSLFIEPVATLSYAKTRSRDLDLPGATVEFGDNESFRGSLGVRFGGEVARTDTYRLEASVTGRIWDEFKGQNSAVIYNAGDPLTVRDSFNSAFGEVGATLNVYSADDHWSGFVNGAYKFNGDAQTGSVKAGLRYSW